MRAFRVRVGSILLTQGLAAGGTLAVATPAAADPTLLSLNKPVTSSGQNPQLANDSDPTNAGGYFDSVLLGGKNAWWQVDLQGVYSLSSIVNRNYVDGSRHYHYYVRGSLDGVHWSAPIAWKTRPVRHPAVAPVPAIRRWQHMLRGGKQDTADSTNSGFLGMTATNPLTG